MKLPLGYRKAGKLLNKALFDPWWLPLLWHRKLSQNFRNIGFQPMPYEPCCLTRNSVTAFLCWWYSLRTGNVRNQWQGLWSTNFSVRSFRNFIAISILSWSKINAFVNVKLEDNVFMRFPPGHRKAGKILILILNRALYGLRKSPALWQKEFASCLVDDIVFAFRKNRETLARGLVEQLRTRYNGRRWTGNWSHKGSRTKTHMVKSICIYEQNI